MGFGKTSSPTLLGQTLDFSASVHLGPDEAFGRECVAAEVSSGDNKLGSDQIRVSVQTAADPNERTIRVTTLRLIDEPVVTVTLTVGCTSRVSRKFVTFLDPPLLNLAQAGETDARTAEPQRVESQVAPLVAMLRPPRSAARPPGAAPAYVRTRVAERPRHRSALGPRMAHAARLAAADQAQAPRERRAAAAPHSAGLVVASVAPRLRLEAASPPLAQAPQASAAAALPRADEATALAAVGDPRVDELQAALAEERERIRMLETGL
ncbi:MAG TPA: hypothetical protein VF308_15545, partial [Caldimonas sp.]